MGGTNGREETKEERKGGRKEGREDIKDRRKEGRGRAAKRGRERKMSKGQKDVASPARVTSSNFLTAR